MPLKVNTIEVRTWIINYISYTTDVITYFALASSNSDTRLEAPSVSEHVSRCKNMNINMREHHELASLISLIQNIPENSR